MLFLQLLRTYSGCQGTLRLITDHLVDRLRVNTRYPVLLVDLGLCLSPRLAKIHLLTRVVGPGAFIPRRMLVKNA